MAALSYLDNPELKHKTKWVMTQGMIELGDERPQIYKKVAQLIVKETEYLYTTDRMLVEAVKELNKDFKAVTVGSVFDFPVYYEKLVKKDQLVLLEGPFPQIVLDKMYAENRL
jgi:UDP-N-acetylmuramyl pentapeptide synthase